MNWMHQALHVARKDVRHTRTPLIVYTLVVLVALAMGVGLPLHADDSTPSMFAVFVLLIFGMILGASAVQSDSPTQSNAFWASRPFPPTAMLGAKVLYCAAVIIGIPLLAELYGLMHFQTSASTIARDLARSSAIYGLMLLATLVIASLTTDIRGFIVGALAIFVGIMALVAIAAISSIGQVPQFVGFSFAFAGPVAMDVIALVGSVALLVWLFRRRDVDRVAWIGAVFAVGALVAVIVQVSAIGMMDGFPRRAYTVPPVTLESAHLVGSPNRPKLVAIQLKLAESRSMNRLNVTIHEGTVRLRDGSVVHLAPTYQQLTFSDPTALLPAGIQPYGSPTVSEVADASLNFRDADGQERAEKVGIATVDLSATIYVADGRQIATTTFGSPASATAAGTRVQIGRARDPSLPYAIDVLAASVNNTNTLITSPISVIVVNEARREGLVLDSQRYSNSSGWMVLPGAPLWTSRVSFNTRRPRDNGMEYRAFSTAIGSDMPTIETNATSPMARFPDAAWYTGAKIGVIQWTPRSMHEVRLVKDLN